MQVLSILQGTSLESTAQAKKNDGNTLTAEEEAVARVYRRCFRICVQVRRHEIFARTGGRDLHRVLAVSSPRFRAHQGA
jgi:hypothetical protein